MLRCGVSKVCARASSRRLAGWTCLRAFGSASSANGAGRLSAENMNQNVLRAQYAVRGELVIKAEQYRRDLDAGKELPFDSIVACNIGNPHELNQAPITFFRQVLALVTFPDLIDDPNASKAFPADAIARAKHYLAGIPGGSGAYSNSQGVDVVRREVADYIEQRDGYKADPDNIFLTDGASAGVKSMLNLLVRSSDEGHKDGVLTPIPQYPLYSATLALLGGHQVPYYLDEAQGWGMAVDHVQAQMQAAKDEQGVDTRALVVINPGNPTGQCLPADNMREIIDVCLRNELVLMADEVYQTNIYGATPFTSFRKVMCDMGVQDDLQLVSYHSVSKGFVGECGRRGGYLELNGFPDVVKEQVYKLASVSLCSNVDGQIMTGLMVNPPKEGDESYALYSTERNSILDSLKRRATRLADALNQMEGVSCNPVEGAMYAFPSITLPAKAVQAAQQAGKAPDLFYCGQLLDQAGLVVVPGSGFGQVDGTWHFRTTILPQEDEFDAVLTRLTSFHARFMKQYE